MSRKILLYTISPPGQFGYTKQVFKKTDYALDLWQVACNKQG